MNKLKRPVTEKERELLLSLIDKIDNPPANDIDLRLIKQPFYRLH